MQSTGPIRLTPEQVRQRMGGRWSRLDYIGFRELLSLDDDAYAWDKWQSFQQVVHHVNVLGSFFDRLLDDEERPA